MTAPGDRIVLIAMPDDPCPVPVGSIGTVTRVTERQVGVKWDNGRTLMLIPGVDTWRPMLPHEDEFVAEAERVEAEYAEHKARFDRMLEMLEGE